MHTPCQTGRFGLPENENKYLAVPYRTSTYSIVTGPILGRTGIETGFWQPALILTITARGYFDEESNLGLAFAK